MCARSFQRGLWKNELNPFVQGGMCYVTKKRAITLNEQLSQIFPLTTCLAFLVLFVAIMATLALLLKTSYIEVAMDILRAAIGTSMILRPIDKLSSSIVMSLIFMFMIISSYLQSHFSADLATVFTDDRLLNNATELFKYGFKMYSRQPYFHYFRGPPFDGKVEEVDTWSECVEKIINESTAVCYGFCNWLKYLIVDKDVRMTEDEFFDGYRVFVIRDDSTLYNRIEAIYRRLYQPGLIQYVLNDVKYTFERKVVLKRFQCINCDTLLIL